MSLTINWTYLGKCCIVNTLVNGEAQSNELRNMWFISAASYKAWVYRGEDSAPDRFFPLEMYKVREEILAEAKKKGLIDQQRMK
jgi:hypothetical protein